MNKVIFYIGAVVLGVVIAFGIYSTDIFSLRLSLPTNSTFAIFIGLLSLPLIVLSLSYVKKKTRRQLNIVSDLASFIYIGFVAGLSAPLILGFGAAWQFDDKGYVDIATVSDSGTTSADSVESEEEPEPKITPEKRMEFLENQNSNTVTYQVTASSKTYQSFYGVTHHGLLYDLPGTYSRIDHGGKPSGFIAENNGDMYIIQGDGSVLKTSSASLETQSAKIISVPNNLISLLDQEIRDPTWFSVKGAIVHDSKLWISSSQKRVVNSKTCWNTSIFVAGLADPLERLDFSLFYSPNECPEKDVEFNAHQAGGFLVPISGELISRDSGDDYLLFSHGDYRARYLAQDDDSVFGSITAINTKDKDDNLLLAKGLRNPQDATLVGNKLYLVEQGPMGGDEVNILDLSLKGLTNFGWPIASYGDQYGRGLKAEAPVLKSHSDYGFKEPAFYWNPSVGIASIGQFTDKGETSIVSGSLGGDPAEGAHSLHFFIEADYSGKRLTLEDFINMETRVRDFVILNGVIYIYSDSGELILLSL